MVEKLYQLWYSDLNTRRQFQLWTILIAFTYGLFNSLGLGRPEQQVTWETLGLVLFLTAAFSAFYCLRTRESTETSTVDLPYAHLSDVFRQNRKLFEVGLATFALSISFYSVVYLFPTSRVQAASMDIRLGRALYSTKPLDENAVKELTAIFRTATADRLSISPRLVNVASKKVTEASQKSPSAWPATLALLNYRSSVGGKTPPTYSQHSCFEGPRIVEGLKLMGCRGQVLDGITWKNVAFENSVIIYHDGPLVLENVQFKNCQFVLDYSPESQELARLLATSDTVTITLPRR
jgi:hypothetical protein